MGRTSNTSELIAKERAHVHFELNVFVNDNFASWYKKNFPGERNDHGIWNGQNLNGLDPREILLDERSRRKFSLLNFVRSQTELCRVLVRATNFPYLKRYAPLVLKNPRAEKEGVAGYEVALELQRRGLRADAARRLGNQGRGEIPTALRQRGGIPRASLPQAGGAARRPLAIDRQWPARTGTAGELNFSRIPQTEFN